MLLRKLKIWWVHYISWPRQRRKLRYGTMVLLSLDERMKRAGWSRKRQRQSMRAIFRTPGQLHFMLDLLYSEANVGRYPE